MSAVAQSRPGSEAGIYELIGKGLMPDWLIRLGIRGMLAQKLKEEYKGSTAAQQAHTMSMVRELDASAIAIEVAAANEQHYQVPTEFFKLCLGRRLKYSCAYYERENSTLDEAEEAMLALTAQRARLEDGLRILELGCGWGSLTLYMAEHYPGATIVAVSNSATQREYIESQCLSRGFQNVRVITADMNSFAPEQGDFDRVVSVEMFEHMKNYRLLLKRIASWLVPGGHLFVHIFSHKLLCYHYEDKDGSDWLTRNYFSGGIMPSNDLYHYFQDDLRITDQWVVNGSHYERTANHWLANMDRNREAVTSILTSAYGADARRWWHFWRLFYMACAELWGFRGGEEWMVSHYLWQKPM